MKLLISMKNQIIKKSFKKIDSVVNNSKLEIINNLENILKKIKNFLINNNWKKIIFKMGDRIIIIKKFLNNYIYIYIYVYILMLKHINFWILRE